MPKNTVTRAKMVREKLYGPTPKNLPEFKPDISKAPPPFQRAIDRRADKNKWSK